MNENEMTGHVVNYMKAIEYQLNCIIENFFIPSQNTGFFSNVLLNSSVVSFGSKIKVIKTICNYKNTIFDPKKLHRLNSIRNIFAHEGTFVDTTVGDFQLIDELQSGGKYKTYKLKELFEEFRSLYDLEFPKIAKLNEGLSKNETNS